MAQAETLRIPHGPQQRENITWRDRQVMLRTAKEIRLFVADTFPELYKAAGGKDNYDVVYCEAGGIVMSKDHDLNGDAVEGTPIYSLIPTSAEINLENGKQLVTLAGIHTSPRDHGKVWGEYSTASPWGRRNIRFVIGPTNGARIWTNHNLFRVEERYAGKSDVIVHEIPFWPIPTMGTIPLPFPIFGDTQIDIGGMKLNQTTLPLLQEIGTVVKTMTNLQRDRYSSTPPTITRLDDIRSQKKPLANSQNAAYSRTR